MATSYVKHVMESMQWTDGSYIPIANNDNRILMDTINELLRQKTEKGARTKEATARLDKLVSHVKNCGQDINHNLKLINAHRSQVTTDNHLLKLALREDSRVNQQNKELEGLRNDLKKYDDTTDSEIRRLSTDLDKLSGKIQWASMALEEWRHAMSRGEETNQLIEKYCKEDRSKAEFLENRRRIIQDSINKQSKILIDSYENQKTLEQTLERTAQLYRQAHAERRQLVTTWKDAVTQMNQREQNIQETEQEIEEAKEHLQLKEQELKSYTDFLNQHLLNNKEAEIVINDLNDNVTILRTQLNSLVDEVSSKETELILSKKGVQESVQKLQQKRQRNHRAASEIVEREKQFNTGEVELANVQERYKKFKNQTLNAQERVRELDELMETEERAKTQLTQEISRLDGLLYRSQQQLYKMKDEEKLIATENRGIEISVQAMRKFAKNLEKELLRKTEIAYDLAHKVEQMELRIGNMQGSESGSDSEKIDHLRELEDLMKQRTKELNSFHTQITKIEDDMRKLTFSYNNDSLEVERMNNKIKERQLFCEGSEKDLQQTILENQEKIVELSIIKMRIVQMEKQISRHEDKAYTLEKHRIELETVINERLVDIRTQSNILFMKRKHIQEERGALKADIGDRTIKIDALKKRYELAVDLLGKNEDGTMITATQVKIGNAQEKQMLLQEGNELNEKVLKAEDDIKAMESTLCLVNFSNDAYRRTFEKVDEETPELVELTKLQDYYCKAITRLKSARSNLTGQVQELEDITEKRDYMDRELEDLNRTRMDINDILMKIHKELVEQKTKIQRAERELKAARKAAIQRCQSHEYISIFERELDLRELEDKNTTVLQQLSDLVESSVELAPVVSKSLYERGMKFPQARRLRSQVSWRSDFSDRSGSDSSIRIFSTSSKEGSVASGGSTGASRKQFRTTISGHASVVSIDFPGDDSIPSGSVTRKSSATKKSQ